jgi:AcrR family transcriptional regulator
MPLNEEETTAPGRDQSDFRRRILDGLALSIREVGLQRTQITDIVRNARTSNRTFYECFPDKTACFVELIDQWSLDTHAAVREAIDDDAPWDEQIDQTVDAYLEIVSQKPELAVTLTRELPSLGLRGVEQEEEDIDRYVDLIMAVTRTESMRREGVEPVDRDIAAMLVGGIAEILDRANRDGKPPDSIGPTVKMVIKRVIGPR